MLIWGSDGRLLNLGRLDERECPNDESHYNDQRDALSAAGYAPVVTVDLG